MFASITGFIFSIFFMPLFDLNAVTGGIYLLSSFFVMCGIMFGLIKPYVWTDVQYTKPFDCGDFCCNFWWTLLGPMTIIYLSCRILYVITMSYFDK